jgi:hypothetical protein
MNGLKLELDMALTGQTSFGQLRNVPINNFNKHYSFIKRFSFEGGQ